MTKIKKNFTKGVFTLVMFGSIKTLSGLIALLVRIIWVSVNTAIQTLVRTKQEDRDSGLGLLPNEL